MLLAAALGLAPDRLMLDPDAILPDAARARMEIFVAERLRFRPVAQILGRRMFWGRWFRVTSDVLDPRPETETLVAAALAGPAPGRILDLGTGSGAILLTLLAELAESHGARDRREHCGAGGRDGECRGPRAGCAGGVPACRLVGRAGGAVRPGGQQPALYPGGRDRRACAGRARLGAARGAYSRGRAGWRATGASPPASTRRSPMAGGRCSKSGRGRGPRWPRSSGRQGSGRLLSPATSMGATALSRSPGADGIRPGDSRLSFPVWRL